MPQTIRESSVWTVFCFTRKLNTINLSVWTSWPFMHWKLTFTLFHPTSLQNILTMVFVWLVSCSMCIIPILVHLNTILHKNYIHIISFYSTSNYWASLENQITKSKENEKISYMTPLRKRKLCLIVWNCELFFGARSNSKKPFLLVIGHTRVYGNT